MTSLVILLKGVYNMKKKSHNSNKKKGHKSKGPNKAYIAGGIIAAIVIIALAIMLFPGKDVQKSDSATVDMYVMSQCPYGVQAENAIAPALDRLGDSVDFNLYFIGGVDEQGNFRSLHGEPEWRGNMVQACAIEHEPDNYMDLVLCMNENPNVIPDNWESCSEELNLDTEKIRNCYEGEEGKELLTESFTISELAGAQGSPTIKINGEDYQGARDANSFTRAICNYVNDPACTDIPVCNQAFDCPQKEGKIPECVNAGTKNAECKYSEDARVELTLVNDETCNSCDATEIINSLRNVFLNLDVNSVDVSTVEGQQLVENYNLEVVPSFIFDKNVENAYIWKNNPDIRTLFEQNNGNYKLLDEVTGATHFVSEEKRLEILNKMGINLDDNKPQIDFFVMSYCPYGNVAEEMVEEVYNKLGDSAEFVPRYVIYSDFKGPEYCLSEKQEYCSLHGRVELNQNVRELCVNKYFGIDDWFEFARLMNSECDYQNADSCWEAVAQGMGLDTEKISDCEQNEAEELLAPQKELNDLLAVRGSPTLFIEGQQYNGARDANSVLDSMCSYFNGDAPSGCDAVIETTNQNVPAGACG